MNDPNWFYFDEKEFRYKLTEKATEIKEAFNEGKIKHITAVEMLTEGKH